MFKLEKTQLAGCHRGKGRGFVLYGDRPDNNTWLERWYPTIEKAKSFCQKRGWEVEDLTQ